MKYCSALLLLTLICFFFNSCLKDTTTKRYVYFKPVYKTKEEVRANMKTGPAQDIKSSGKIYVKGNYIFLNEMDKGVHIIDYSNPANPKNIAFIAIPGNEDIAVQGDYLFADEYTDLVTFDISNPLNIKLVDTDAGAFPERYYSPDADKVIIDWIKVDTIVKGEVDNWWRIDYVAVPEALDMSKAATPGQAGIGGSMARFTLMSNRLYTVSSHSLNVFNIENSKNPAFVTNVNAGFDIETIYPFKNKLFIGSQEGMYIFNADNPDAPYQVGTFTHAQACDPVIADDKYAYVTLRTGNTCNNETEDVLHVLDVTDPANATLLKSYPFTNPHGLAKDGNLLFICDGKDGLKLLNAADPLKIKPITTVGGLETYDVIALNKTAIVSAKGGLYLINYSTPANAQVVGQLTINQ
jgi:hypothetical protein